MAKINGIKIIIVKISKTLIYKNKIIIIKLYIVFYNLTIYHTIIIVLN